MAYAALPAQHLATHSILLQILLGLDMPFNSSRLPRHIVRPGDGQTGIPWQQRQVG